MRSAWEAGRGESFERKAPTDHAMMPKPSIVVPDPKSMEKNGPKPLTTVLKATVLHTFAVQVCIRTFYVRIDGSGSWNMLMLGFRV